MHKQPILLRRTSSSIPSGPASTTVGGVESAAIPPAPGSGGHIDPNMAIPIADESPGNLSSKSLNSHKRKQSGIPLEAEMIIHRASVQTSLEQITDEEEGEFDRISRSNSELDMNESPRSLPEMSDFFPDGSSSGNGNGGGWSFKSLLTSRGIASVALLVATIALVTLKSHSTAKDASAAGPNGSSAGNSVNHPPGSKDITIGEFHEAVVGTPMEHHVNEYNKIRFYDSPSKMKAFHSKGPILHEKEMGGLHWFENVCLTNNVDQDRYRPARETSLRGLIYFTDDKEILGNSKRCVPCSNHEPLVDWNEDANHDETVVGHKCGMNGLHAMYASSVQDWTDCIMEPENAKLMKKWGQTQSPVNVSTIHYFQEPTFVLQFNAYDMEQSLFDMLMTYLPHWADFLEGDGDDDSEKGFPFNSVISHSLQGCLSHSHNWFCEVLHQMYAFGEAKEIPWEGDDNTLYCYRELFTNQLGYQRNLEHEGLVTKENFGNFRELLFRKFGLPRRRTVEDRLADAEYEAKKNNGETKKKKGGEDNDEEVDTKIIFYDNKLSEQTVWNEMESLISKARELEKFQHIKFVTVDRDFNDLSVAQQARKFNEADAIIMAHGQHMANAIFAIDGTSFVEVGCKVESLIGNPKFMGLMDGKYRAVEKCEEKDSDNVCVRCKGDEDEMNFTMTPKAFEQLIDDVVASLGE